MRRKAKPVPLAPSWEGGKAGGGEVLKRASGRRGCLDLSGMVISNVVGASRIKKLKEITIPVISAPAGLMDLDGLVGRPCKSTK